MQKGKEHMNPVKPFSRILVLFCMVFILSAMSLYGAGNRWVSHGPYGGGINALENRVVNAQS